MLIVHTNFRKINFRSHHRLRKYFYNKNFQIYGSIKFVLPNIDPSMLEDPVVDGRVEESYIGRGSFGIVRLQVYRGIHVDVKEFLPCSLVHDVTNEANLAFLSSLPSLSVWCLYERKAI